MGGDAWPQAPMPSARVCRDHTVPVGEESMRSGPMSVVGILPEEAEDQDQFKVMWSSVIAAQLFRHPALGEMYIDLLTCTLSVMDLGVNPMADCPILTLEELLDLD